MAYGLEYMYPDIWFRISVPGIWFKISVSWYMV